MVYFLTARGYFISCQQRPAKVDFYTKPCPKDTFLNFSIFTCTQKELNHAPTLFPKIYEPAPNSQLQMVTRKVLHGGFTFWGDV
jgi:hypothetical protein